MTTKERMEELMQSCSEQGRALQAVLQIAANISLADEIAMQALGDSYTDEMDEAVTQVLDLLLIPLMDIVEKGDDGCHPK